jgi:hypothetical protein
VRASTGIAGVDTAIAGRTIGPRDVRRMASQDGRRLAIASAICAATGIGTK